MFVSFLLKTYVPPRLVIQNIVGVYIQFVGLLRVVFQASRDPVSLAVRRERVSDKNKSWKREARSKRRIECLNYCIFIEYRQLYIYIAYVEMYRVPGMSSNS